MSIQVQLSEEERIINALARVKHPRGERDVIAHFLREANAIQPILAPLRERVQRAEQRVRDLEAAIRWALGEEGEFPSREAGQGAYWWRTELRQRAALRGTGEGSNAPQ